MMSKYQNPLFPVDQQVNEYISNANALISFDSAGLLQEIKTNAIKALKVASYEDFIDGLTAFAKFDGGLDGVGAAIPAPQGKFLSIFDEFVV
jgi:hypothetical protein